MNTFLLKIVTPKRDFYTGEIDYLCIDTPDGKQGFLRGALPRVGVISRGTAEITTSVLKLKAFCGDGIYKVDDRGVLLLETVVISRATSRRYPPSKGRATA